MAELRLLRLLPPTATSKPTNLLTEDDLRQRIEQYQKSDAPRKYKIAVGSLCQFPLVLDEEREEAAAALRAANDEFMHLHDLDVQSYPVSMGLGFSEPDNRKNVGLLQLAGMLEYLHPGAIIYGPHTRDTKGVLYDNEVYKLALERGLAKFQGNPTQQELEKILAEFTHKRWTPLEKLLADPRITRPVMAPSRNPMGCDLVRQ